MGRRSLTSAAATVVRNAPLASPIPVAPVSVSMRLADAPEGAAVDGPSIAFPAGLLRGDPRLEALFAPLRECVVLHEAEFHEGNAARGTRLLMAEVRGDILDELRAVVRGVCPKSAFEEKPTELDDVASGTEWRDKAGSLSVSAYRLFGGSTALHVRSSKVDAPDAGMLALLASPLAVLAPLVTATSFVDNISCSRAANEPPRWHLQATLRDLRRFEEVVPAVAELGFEERRGKYWRETIILQPIGKDRWMAALPGIDFGTA